MLFNKYFHIIFAIVLGSCKGEQKLALEASDIFISGDVEVPVYDFKNFETLLKLNDGKIRVINFWATWCKPCVAELPYFEMIDRRYTNDKVEVILVSLDLPNKVESKLIPFIKNQSITSKVVLLDDPDANTWIPKIDKDWSGAIPATIIYKGNNSRFYERSFTYNDLEKELRRFE